ncbi:hypothetical protein LTR36_004309 [Oleoguttula mirabilis]|uniref:ADP-ribose 1''-phosphate phosphatase n=1 Tax=Oleoguttula mirabilis TaxID=1507867 RepID=A0AAV9JHH0_9PEZI|nr:hypothetical protein LTR36_004309 [Oleoguttula mirabilis]
MDPPPRPSALRHTTLRLGAGGIKANTAAKRKSPSDPSPDDRRKRMRSITASNKSSAPQHCPNRRIKGDTPIPDCEQALSPASTDNSSTTATLQIEEAIGDIFAAPPNTLLIHACNCEGSWGAGIAQAFRDHYPAAYDTYAAHCDEHAADELFGRALLIPPSKADDGASEHFVGCLFTSRSMGRKKDSPSRILGATGPAMEDLLELVRECNGRSRAESDGEGEGRKVGEVRMCQINSRLFNVPWKKTKAVLEGIEVGDEDDDVKVVKVVSRE